MSKIKNIVCDNAKELSNEEISEVYNELNDKHIEYDFDKLKKKICNCDNGGVFVVLPTSHDSVKDSKIRYMQCRVCGKLSSL